MIIATTSICEKYKVLDTFFIIDQYAPKGFLGSGGFDFDSDFAKTKVKIEEIVRSSGGDAAIGCNFEVRMAQTQLGGSQVFEVFCFGTIVKLLD